VLGRGFWDVHPGRGQAGRGACAISDVYGRRIESYRRLANAARRAEGAEGGAPRWVVDAFAMMLSAFATNAMESYEVPDPGQLSARILSVVLSEAIGDQVAHVPSPQAPR
jgi:Lon protease-like protein